MIVLNIYLHRFIFPGFNQSKIRGFAEQMGTLVEPGSAVAIYRSAMSYKFNFYSRTRRFEEIPGPAELQTWLGRDDARFILTRERFIGEIKTAAGEKIQLVLAESVTRERWALLSACGNRCGRAASADQVSDSKQHGAD